MKTKEWLEMQRLKDKGWSKVGVNPDVEKTWLPVQGIKFFIYLVIAVVIGSCALWLAFGILDRLY